MSVLSDIQLAITPLGIPIETGVFKGEAPERYIVVVPIADTFDLHADNVPGYDVQEARLSLYSQGNYMKDNCHYSERGVANGFRLLRVY